MYNPLLIQFQNLPEDRQVMIWQQLIMTPAFTEFLVDAKKSIELQYFNLPEPETFEAADMAKNYAEKRQLKAAANVIDNLLGIDKYMRDKTDSI